MTTPGISVITFGKTPSGHKTADYSSKNQSIDRVTFLEYQNNRKRKTDCNCNCAIHSEFFKLLYLKVVNI